MKRMEIRWIKKVWLVHVLFVGGEVEEGMDR